MDLHLDPMFCLARVKNKTGDLTPFLTPLLPPNHGVSWGWHNGGNGDNYHNGDNNNAQCAYLPFISVIIPFHALPFPLYPHHYPMMPLMGSRGYGVYKGVQDGYPF